MKLDSSADGTAMLGHRDRTGLRRPAGPVLELVAPLARL